MAFTLTCDLDQSTDYWDIVNNNIPTSFSEEKPILPQVVTATQNTTSTHMTPPENQRRYLWVDKANKWQRPRLTWSPRVMLRLAVAYVQKGRPMGCWGRYCIAVDGFIWTNTSYSTEEVNSAPRYSLNPRPQSRRSHTVALGRRRRTNKHRWNCPWTAGSGTFFQRSSARTLNVRCKSLRPSPDLLSSVLFFSSKTGDKHRLGFKPFFHRFMSGLSPVHMLLVTWMLTWALGIFFSRDF